MQTIIITGGNLVKRESCVYEKFSYLDNDTDCKTVAVDEGKKMISIAQARELIKFASLRPINSKRKLVYIKEAQSLTSEAQNSLLKLLEEPPAYLQVVLSVDNVGNLIDTVVSRCVVKYLDNVDLAGANSGFSNLPTLFPILKMDIGERFDWMSENSKMFKDRQFAIDVLKLWELFLRDIMIASLGVKISGSPSLELLTVANMHTSKEWLRSIVYLKEVTQKIQVNNANISLGFESLLLDLPLVVKI